VIVFCALSLFVFGAAGQCTGAGSEIYHGTINQLSTLFESCPGGKGWGGHFIELATPADLPWEYTQLCVLMAIINDTAATYNLPMQVVVYDAAGDPRSNMTPASTTPVFSVAKTATVKDMSSPATWNAFSFSYGERNFRKKKIDEGF
jgi:hypothetical protein